eukprot:1159927-Pelagomonas_calceolata.AAC.5
MTLVLWRCLDEESLKRSHRPTVAPLSPHYVHRPLFQVAVSGYQVPWTGTAAGGLPCLLGRVSSVCNRRLIRAWRMATSCGWPQLEEVLGWTHQLVCLPSSLGRLAVASGATGLEPRAGGPLPGRQVSPVALYRLHQPAAAVGCTGPAPLVGGLLSRPASIPFVHTGGTDDRLRLWDALDWHHWLVAYPETRNKSVRGRQCAVTADGAAVFHPSGSVIQKATCITPPMPKGRD